MSRYIDAELIKAEFTGNFIEEYPTSLIKAIIDDAPTADVEEVRHGKWIRKRQFVYECSLCKRIELVEGIRNDCDLESEYKILFSMYPYCHCGARMDLTEVK